ncbi:MAG: DUF853 family protein [Burkholderiaceae bacterium]|nr:DUF853 family protein [Burkholderiaceae bacterium]
MVSPIVIGTIDGKSEVNSVNLLPEYSNRHGCISGATGTGKTVTLQKIAESFSDIGVPVFMADIKGDLSGIAKPTVLSEKLKARLEKYHLQTPTSRGCPVTFWDVFGEQGHPVRATISDMGPLLLGRLLQLNETQSGVLNAVYKIADDNGLLLIDLKDLRSMLTFVGEHAKEFRAQYGNVSLASIGAIQRGLLALESQGADKFFGEPMLDINDLLQTVDGKGVVNILSADKLMLAPKLYATFLLWILSELYENLPEVGDLEKPKLVFFFDEAHLLFNDVPDAFIEKVEQVVRLIRSKGVGIFFITQNPLDIPEKILGQLGNRVQHGLRAFTPRDQKAVRTCAQTMRSNPNLDLETSITQLAVGQALVSTLQEDGIPGVTELTWIGCPGSQIGPISQQERLMLMAHSLVAGVYDKAVDRESAYEKLQSNTTDEQAEGSSITVTQNRESKESQDSGSEFGSAVMNGLKEILFGRTGPRGGRTQGVIEQVARSTVRQAGRQLVRGLLGSLLGRK